MSMNASLCMYMLKDCEKLQNKDKLENLKEWLNDRLEFYHELTKDFKKSLNTIDVDDSHYQSYLKTIYKCNAKIEFIKEIFDKLEECDENR